MHKPLNAMFIRSIGFDEKNGLLLLTFGLDEDARITSDYLQTALKNRIPVWIEFDVPAPAETVVEGEVIEGEMRLGEFWMQRVGPRGTAVTEDPPPHVEGEVVETVGEWVKRHLAAGAEMGR